MILDLLQDAYISTIRITPMHVKIKLVSDMLFSGSSCQSRRAGVLCSVPETMRDMCNTHKAVDSHCDKENSSPLPVTG